MDNVFESIFGNDYCGSEKIFDELIIKIWSNAEKANKTFTINTGDKKFLKKITAFGLEESSDIVFYDVELAENINLSRNRQTIKRYVIKLIDNYQSALIFFHYTDNSAEWRISYVFKGKNNSDVTNPKRYTYLCGKNYACKTTSQRFEFLVGKENINEDDLLEAFSVEPLSKEFFEKYREHYADLVEYISGKRFVKKGGKFVEENNGDPNPAFKKSFGGDDKAVRDYVKKMMGRLVFLHFLQKKGWLGVKKGDAWGSGDRNFIYNLFQNADENVKKDFLEQALAPLFFNTLNTDRGEDAIAPKSICDIYGKKIRIPYLNGGLFEEDELDKKKVKFKDEHFEALLEFFNQYNFTIDETDPDDTEIGVDPEMLGKIFENLLEDNKDKGAFYTPKEIVQYMCRESLIAYLNEKVSSEEKIRKFVLTHEHSFTEKEKKDIHKALLDVKICDPAVGSGAFPMGMLNELLACTLALVGESEPRAELKKHIVKNNVYGVDIEKGAVDIARLRFWLAIIVDEENPLPLPNLDYKIMQGNSLLESFEGVDLSDITKREVEKDDWFDEKNELKKQTNALIDAFELNMQEYFDTNDHKKKQQLKNEINDFVKLRVLNTLGVDNISLNSKIMVCENNIKEASNNIKLVLDKKAPIYKKYEKIIKQNTEQRKELLKEKATLTKKQINAENAELDVTKYFLWHTWFNDVFNRGTDCNKNGFDIVIGNPPYVFARDAHFSDDFKKTIEKYYFKKLSENKKTKANQSGKINLFALFILQGLFLASDKGVLSYIVPNNILRTTTYDLIRKYILENTAIKSIVDLGSGVFEKVTASTITLELSKVKKEDNKVCVLTDVKKLEPIQASTNLISQNQFLQNTSYAINIFSDEKFFEINQKINSNSSSFGEFCIDIIEGIVAKKSVIFTEAGKNRYPMLEGKCIKKYVITGINKYIEWNITEIHRTRPDYLWKQEEKLVTQRISGGSHPIIVAYDNSKYKAFASTNCIVLRDEFKHLYKYFLALLNSNVLNWYYANNFSNNSELTVNISKTYLEKLPIPTATKKQQQEIITLVDKILKAKKQAASADTSSLEKEIDSLVYKLYNLSKEEIAIIEGN